MEKRKVQAEDYMSVPKPLSEQKTLEVGDVVTYGKFPQWRPKEKVEEPAPIDPLKEMLLDVLETEGFPRMMEEKKAESPVIELRDGYQVFPIEWIVLEVSDGKALLLSKYGLIAKPVHMKDEDIRWEECTLNSWLNDEFLRDAFTEQEQMNLQPRRQDLKIETVHSRQEMIFLLGIEDAENYFTDAKARSCSPTEYAVKSGAFESERYQSPDGCKAGWWWLQSPSSYASHSFYVDLDGSIHFFGHSVNVEVVCVRPAFWYKL